MPATARVTGAGLLAVALMASLAPAGHAAASQATGHSPAAARFVPAGGPAMLRMLAAEAAARARVARAHGAQSAGTGIISGVVRTPIKSASCVTVVGRYSRSIARTGPDGRYLVGGLRPGRYRVSASACGAAQASRHPLISASWTTGPATATVRAGRVASPAPISLWYLGKNWLTAPSTQAPSQQGPAASAGPRPRFGSISGLVTGHGHPQRGVCAVAFSYDGGAKFAVTTKSGAYRIGGLRPGRYIVMFIAGVKQHCPNNGNWLQQWYPRVNAPIPSSHVKVLRVRAGKAIRGIDARLQAGGELAGRVRATSGRAIRGICVSVAAEIDRSQIGVFYNLVTDKAGRYALHGVFAGKYQVEFFIGCGSKGNYAFQWWRDTSSANHASTIRIAGTKKVTNVNATLQPGAIVTGVVKAVTAKGKALAGVCVSAVGSDEDEDAFANSRLDGGYRLDGLAAGRYQIQFDPSCIGDGNSPYLFLQRNVTVGTGQTVAGFNGYLPLGGGITGLVTDQGGHPAGGVCVQVEDDNGEVTRTHANGKYSVSGVSPGSFPVQFFGGCGSKGSLAPQFYHQPPSSLFATPIKFRANTVTPNIDVTMLPGGTLAGVVTDTAGRRLSRICVSAEPSNQPAPTESGSFDTTTHSGRYLLANLPPGSYDMSFGCGGYGTQFYPAQPTPESANLVAVNAGVTTRIGARLRLAGAIAGTLRRTGGKPVEFGCVEASLAGSSGGFFPANIAFADQKGRYRLGGLTPGRYLVLFSDCSGRGVFGSQWYRRQSSESAATPVKVVSGRTDRGINALLTAGGSIAGRVTGPAGKPARDVCVFAFSSTGVGMFTQTGRLGRYRATGLSTGRWSLNFTACGPNQNLGAVTLSGIRVTAPHTHGGVNLRMPPGGSISGAVTSRAGNVPIGGSCVLTVPVSPHGSAGIAVTDRHGDYSVTDLAAGRYRVFISDSFCGPFTSANAPFAPQWYADQATEATAGTVRLPAGGAVTGINAALSLFGAVTGTVQTSGHAAVAGECVTAVPFRTPSNPLFDLPAQAEVAITGRNGGYNLTQLAPGRYKIEFSTGCGDRGFATQWWDNAGSASSAKVIKVKFATISGIDATLRR